MTVDTHQRESEGFKATMVGLGCKVTAPALVRSMTITRDSMIKTWAHSSQLVDRMNPVVDLWQQTRLLLPSDSQMLPGIKLGHCNRTEAPENNRIKGPGDHRTGGPHAQRTTCPEDHMTGGPWTKGPELPRSWERAFTVNIFRCWSSF